jgi:hypothetical protein
MAFDFSKFTPDIFKLKSKDEIVIASSDHETEHISFEQDGFRRAGHMNGSTEGLKICLHRVFQERLTEMRRDINKQQELRKPYRVSLQELTITTEGLKSQIKELQEGIIPSKYKKIEELKNDIADIRRNPEHYSGNHVKIPGFFIGLGILILLTVYLFVFYSSASYSALFKDFTPDEMVIAKAIFDGQAISKALKDGTAELILILTIPAVFLGLGYLIHKFQETKNKTRYIKIAALLIVTFIFDVIIAYDITEKIYDIKRAGVFENIPPEYSFKIAFANMSFWLIIFAGFIVYLIWGFVFDFVLDSYSKLDHVKVHIKIKQEQIEGFKKEVEDHEAQISVLKSDIEKNKIEANKLKETIEGTIVVTKEMSEALSQFMVGWYRWLSGGRAYNRSEHNKIFEEFVIANINIIPPVMNSN